MPVENFAAAQEELKLRTAAGELIERLQFMRQAGLSFGGDRDMYAVLGYTRVLGYQDYRARYERGGIAKRIVEALPHATWRGDMWVEEDEDPKRTTIFEKAWDALETQLKITAVMRRADVLAGLSTYSVVLIGAPGDFDTELRKGKPEDLLYLTPFSGGGGPGMGQRRTSYTNAVDADATIHSLVTDTSDPRFGQPLFYQLRRLEVSDPQFQKPVHWSRILHLAEGCLDSDVYGTPTLEACFNLLDDLDKVTGGGAEAFFLRANQGMHINVDKDLALSVAKDQVADLKEQAENYKHQLTRWIRTRGVEVTPLGSDVANFSNPADAILTQISGTKSIPKRILTGSEMGELASSQDRDNWKDIVNGRQTSYAGPYIVRPLVDRFIKYGYLPTPKKGPEAYEVRWPHIQTLTDQEKSAGALEWAQTATAEGPVFMRDEIRDKWYGMQPLPKPDVAEDGTHTSPEGGLDVDPKIDPETGLPLKVVAPTMGVDPSTGLPVEVDAKTGLPGHAVAGLTPKQKAQAVEQAKIDAKEKADAARAHELKLKAATDGPHTYSSTQIQLPQEMAAALTAFGEMIPEEDLDAEGLETDPHITVKYGLHTNDSVEVEEVLHGVGPIRFTLGMVGFFATEACDVVVVNVQSPDLRRTNALLSDSLEVTNTHPVYKPHATVAYVKTGLGSKYVGNAAFAGMTATVDQILFSPADGEKVTMGLRAAGGPGSGRYPKGSGEMNHPTHPLPDAAGETQRYHIPAVEAFDDYPYGAASASPALDVTIIKTPKGSYHMPELPFTTTRASVMRERLQELNAVPHRSRVAGTAQEEFIYELAKAIRENRVEGVNQVLASLRSAGDVAGHEFHGNQWTGGPHVVGDGAADVRAQLATFPKEAIKGSDIDTIFTIHGPLEIAKNIDDYLLKHYDMTAEKAGWLIDRQRGVMIAQPKDVPAVFGRTLGKKIESPEWQKVVKDHSSLTPTDAMSQSFSDVVSNIGKFVDPISLLADAALPLFKKWGWA